MDTLDGADRGGKVGAAVECAIGGGPRAGAPARPSQSGDAGSRAQTGSVRVGGGQIRRAVSADRYSGGAGNSRRPAGPSLMTVLPLSRSSPFWGMGAGGPEFASPRLNCGAPWTTGSHSRKIQPGGGKGTGGSGSRTGSRPTVLAPTRRRSPGRSSLTWGLHDGVTLPICPGICFQAGRFPQISTSWKRREARRRKNNAALAVDAVQSATCA